EKNVWLERIYESEPVDLEEVWSRYAGYAERLAPYVGDVSLLVDDALRAGKQGVFEGAQATVLGLDPGTYPFVTSSNPIPPRAGANRQGARCLEVVRHAGRRGPVPVRDPRRGADTAA